MVSVGKNGDCFRRKKMRKKSHILLARCLADQVQAIDLQSHRKAFCLGSILPDLKPSFLTTKHEFNVNFELVQKKIRTLTIDCRIDERNARVYWRQLGEVTHHVADYFTFPHNDTYEGTLLEHGQYEAELKRGLKKYINNGEAIYNCRKGVRFTGFEQIITFIKRAHELYVSKERNVQEDIQFIITVCYQVMQGIVHLLEKKLEITLNPCFA